MRITIYLDVVFLINSLCNLVILLSEGWILSWTGQRKWKPLRIAAGAAAGGLGYCIYILLARFSFGAPFAGACLGLLFGGFLPLLMLRIAFGKQEKKRMGRLLLFFFMLSFCLSGFLGRMPWGERKGSLPGMAAYGGLFFFGIFLLKKGLPAGKEALYYRIQLYYRGKMLEGKALWDTGNRLVDACSGKPVFLADWAFAQELFSKEEREAMGLLFNGGSLPALWEGPAVRTVPFCSVGRKRGLLYGVVADAICIKPLEEGGEAWKCFERPVAAFAPEGLGGGYQLLLPGNLYALTSTERK